MKLFHHHQDPGPPCKMVEPMLNKTADGSANFFTRLYAISHAAKCRRCGDYLHRLEETLQRVKSARKSEPPADAVARLEAIAAQAAGAKNDHR